MNISNFDTRWAQVCSAAGLALTLTACGGGSDPAASAARTGMGSSNALTASTTTTSTTSTVAARSCSYTDVSAAVQSAVSGQTVTIPAGDCSWGANQLAVPGGVYLQGAGADSTIIRRSANVTRGTYLIAYSCGNGKVADVSRIGLVGMANSTIQDAGLGLSGGCADFKVSASSFSNFTYAGVVVGDAPNQRGVIFQNKFTNNFAPALGDLGFGIVVRGGGAWPSSVTLGTNNAVFVEDNSFVGNRQSVASNNGASFVFRHNTVGATDATKDYMMLNVDGLGTATHGTRSYEIYENAFATTATSGKTRTAMAIFGGDGVIFNNTSQANITRTVEMDVSGFKCGSYPGPDQIRSLYIWNNTGGTAGYSVNGIDNNCPTSIGANRDVFLAQKTGYTPYTYPHPLRATASPGPVTSTTSTGTTSTTSGSTCSYPDWVWGKSYVTGNIVRYPDNGKYYIATHDNPGWDPTISTYFWSPYTASCSTTSGTTSTTTDPTTTTSGSTTTTSGTTSTTSGTTTTTTSGSTCSYPDWVWGKSYVTGNIVRYPDNGKYYIATHDNPGWDPTISTYFWSPYTASCSTSTTSTGTTSGTTSGTTTTTTSTTPITSGPTVTAASCQYTAVASAVANAASGSTVVIPAGDCSWGSSQLSVPGGIALRGAGQDKTIIRRTAAVSENQYLVAYNCSNGGQATFSGMTLVGYATASVWDKGLGLLGGCKDFRVTDSKFTKFTFAAVYVGDAPGQRGVIWKNNFVNNYTPALANLGYGVVVYGGGAWPNLDLGGPNAVFVEDNYFIGNRHNVASNNGSVYVFRYNTVVGTDAAKDYAMTDAHGVSSSPRGSRSYEIYNNNYSTQITSGLQRTAIGIRGGDGVIFNNTAPATISRTIELMTEGFSCGTYPGPDQIRSVYIWNNSANPSNGYTTNGIDNTCPSSIGLNRDYFLTPRPGYTPYTYPHPMRAQ